MIKQASSSKKESEVGRKLFPEYHSRLRLDAAEIEETQRRLEQALQELEITKHEEERLLQEKVVECQQEYLDAMTCLQEQFLAQVGHRYGIRRR